MATTEAGESVAATDARAGPCRADWDAATASSQVKLRDGSAVLIRPVGGADAPLLAGLLRSSGASLVKRGSGVAEYKIELTAARAQAA